MDLANKNALVTGSSQGIGKELALALAQQGANVMIHCRDEIEAGQQAADLVRQLGVKSGLIVADLALEHAVDRIANEVQQQFGTIDLLILNASVQFRKPWLDVTTDEFNQQMIVNWQRTLQLIQRFAPSMQQRGWGRILTIGSIQQIKPHPDMIAYAATKAGVLNMVRNLALQLAGSGITVNNLAPGVILTERNTDALADEDYRKRALGRIPVAFFGEPHDCAVLAVLLCSEAGRYITGQDIFVDGGMGL
ncbi:SDR family oxidoreductase [Dyadobacter psychrotolerans]|uniref:SDR family oxidoreductase n=1 Tax=Dyadobacter psychrotolerans TaxID=2541721 RepID=A0A4V2Z353_9BACT|nr:SDR family oxidoreductase [Dyadobacter psychrotolerans]